MGYNLEKLAQIDEFDMGSAVKNFVSYDMYFDALDDFAQKASHYLTTYTPAVIAFSDEVREDFLRELDEIQLVLVKFGMLHYASELTDLRNAAAHSEVKILEDGLRTFQADMDIIAHRIIEARL